MCAGPSIVTVCDDQGNSEYSSKNSATACTRSSSAPATPPRDTRVHLQRVRQRAAILVEDCEEQHLRNGHDRQRTTPASARTGAAPRRAAHLQSIRREIPVNRAKYGVLHQGGRFVQTPRLAGNAMNIRGWHAGTPPSRTLRRIKDRLNRWLFPIMLSQSSMNGTTTSEPTCGTLALETNTQIQRHTHHTILLEMSTETLSTTHLTSFTPAFTKVTLRTTNDAFPCSTMQQTWACRAGPARWH